jgi:hypothetical protein
VVEITSQQPCAGDKPGTIRIDGNIYRPHQTGDVVPVYFCLEPTDADNQYRVVGGCTQALELYWIDTLVCVRGVKPFLTSND